MAAVELRLEPRPFAGALFWNPRLKSKDFYPAYASFCPPEAN